MLKNAERNKADKQGKVKKKKKETASRHFLISLQKL